MSSYYTGIKGIDSKLHLFNVRGGSRRVSCVSYENLLKYLVSLELSMGHTISYILSKVLKVHASLTITRHRGFSKTDM